RVHRDESEALRKYTHGVLVAREVDDVRRHPPATFCLIEPPRNSDPPEIARHFLHQLACVRQLKRVLEQRHPFLGRMCGQKSVAKGLTREEVFRAVVRSRERVQAASNPQSPCQVEGPKTTFERIGE